MVATQVGGHGVRIYQCRSAMLTTTTKISMQVDGEPCRLNPSKIKINIRNQANMISKKKPHRSIYPKSTESIAELITPKRVRTKLYYLSFQQYDALVKFDIEEIRSVVQELCPVEIDPEWQLDDFRRRLESMKEIEDTLASKLHNEWCFLDATWTARIYRIDDAQELLLHVGDILEGGIYVLDCLRKTEHLPQTVATVIAQQSPSLQQKKNNTITATATTTATIKNQSVEDLHINHNHRHNHFNNNTVETNGSTTLTNRWKSFDLSATTTGGLPTPGNLTSGCGGGSMSSDFATSSGSDSDLGSDSLSSAERSASQPSIEDIEIDLSSPDDFNEKDKMLLDVARKGFYERFKKLHESGAKLSACDFAGRTPLHLAARYGYKDIVEYILENVPLTVVDLMDQETGQTALHKAALHKRRTVCRLLVRKGASLFRADLEGNTPQQLALKSLDHELAKFLQKEEQLQLIAADDHETAV